jgi:hypothetical protein
MESPPSAILTPYNYFEWKQKMEIFLRGRGLYRLTMAMETKPTSSIEKSKYLNRMDEAYRALCMHMSPELLFHVSTCKTPNEIWTTMEGLFGKQDEMRGHMLEVELLALDPKILKTSRISSQSTRICCCNSRLAGVDKSKEEKRMVLTILSKLGPEYSSLFPHSTLRDSLLEHPGLCPLWIPSLRP